MLYDCISAFYLLHVFFIWCIAEVTDKQTHSLKDKIQTSQSVLITILLSFDKHLISNKCQPQTVIELYYCAKQQ